jgi:putative spermidine/putrescine transport system ATP-binding protein
LAAGCRILFLDEPMSSLDPKIGIKLRYEIQKTARKLGLTVIHVTHDQADAMSISDRIIVMRQGTIAQVGTSREVYYKPASPYVAHFIGESNFIKAKADGVNTVSLDGHILDVKNAVANLKDIVIAIRPEKILFEKRLDNTFEGVIEDVKFLGPTTRFIVRVDDLTFKVSTAKHPELKKGARVSIYIPPGDILIFSGIKDLDGELKIL